MNWDLLRATISGPAPALPDRDASPPLRDLVDQAILRRGSNIVYLLTLNLLVDPKAESAEMGRGFDSLSSISLHSAPCRSIGKRERKRGKGKILMRQDRRGK